MINCTPKHTNVNIDILNIQNKSIPRTIAPISGQFSLQEHRLEGDIFKNTAGSQKGQEDTRFIQKSGSNPNLFADLNLLRK